MKKFTSPTQQKGELAETIVCNYLIRRGFVIVERNFTRTYGEIDVVAQKGEIIHFIEVKSVLGNYPDFRPENRVGYYKSRRLIRIIETYILSHKINTWQLDVVCLYLDMVHRRARIKVMSDIILG